MDLSELYKKLAEQRAQLNSSQDAAVSGMADRADRILNPGQAGPDLPSSTPEEDAYYQNAVTAVAGSVKYPKLRQLFGTTPKEQAAMKMSDVVHRTAEAGMGGMDEVNAATQRAGREISRANDFREALARRKRIR